MYASRQVVARGTMPDLHRVAWYGYTYHVPDLDDDADEASRN